MNKIYEVNLSELAARTVYIGAECAEDAVEIAKTLFKCGAISLVNGSNVCIEAVSTDHDDYWEDRIKKENENTVFGTDARCKNCELYALLSTIFPQEKNHLE